MTRHKWADLIIDWAEGAEIQFSSVRNTDDEGWYDCTDTPLWNSELFKFRRKPKEPDWWENIPEHGVLCWVSDIDETIRNNIIERITSFVNEYSYHGFRSKTGAAWKYATPLTNEEIERFKR